MSGESFDFKQGYEYAISEVHKKYNLRSKKNTEITTKKSVKIQTEKITESPMKKVLQILPRGTQGASSPKIINITSAETQTSNASETIPNNKIQNKIACTQTKFPSAEKEDGITLTTIAQEDLTRSGKTQFSFNIKTEIAKLKILVPLKGLVKNQSYKAQTIQTLNIVEGEDVVKLDDD